MDEISTLRRQAARMLLSYAFLRWESAATLALTAILVFLFPDPFRGALPFWRGWFWLILGTLAETIIVLATLFDADMRADLVLRPIRDRADVDRLGTDHEDAIIQALVQRERIELFLQRTRDRAVRRAIVTVVDGISRWILTMNALALVLSRCQGADRLRHRDQVARDEVQAAKVGSASPAHGPDRAAPKKSGKGTQGKAEALASAELIERAGQQIKDDLAALQDVYVQLQLAVAGGIDSLRMRRLHRQVQGHVQTLQEFVQALDCVPNQTPQPVSRDRGARS